MKKGAIILISLSLFSMLQAQVLIDDFRVNNLSQNLKGLGRTAIAAHSDGSFAVAWHDFNDYDFAVAEQPRIAAQLFSATGTPVGPTNLFRGESRSLSIWTSDFLEPNPDIAFHPDGTLLLAVEHEGRLALGGDDIGSAECGLAVVLSNGEKLDASGPERNGDILWLISTKTKYQERPRIAVAPSGDFFMTMDGPTYDTNNSSVLIQQFDNDGNYVGDFFNPHTTDPGPAANHRFPDIATNGNTHAVIWQDGRQDANWDISIQFYNNSGATGGNVKVNSTDANGTVNIWPAIAMNADGNSVAVWADTRNSAAGDIYGQLYSPDGTQVGQNFSISSGEGEIMDRPEVAMLNDGQFMVVWVDSLFGEVGENAFAAVGRQFDANGNPLGDTFALPNQKVNSGFVNIASDGTSYYLSWLDNRDNSTYYNLYAKKIGPLATSVAMSEPVLPAGIQLYEAYPNPFNPTTTIQFSVDKRTDVRIGIYDLLGRKITTIVDQEFQPGVYKAVFEAGDLPSGLYIYRIQAEGFSDAKKLMLLK